MATMKSFKVFQNSFAKGKELNKIFSAITMANRGKMSMLNGQKIAFGRQMNNNIYKCHRHFDYDNHCLDGPHPVHFPTCFHV